MSKAQLDLAPNRELQLGAVKIYRPISQFVLATGVFSMLAGTSKLPVDGFNQLMVMVVRLH